jgi:hypothetical protein
LISSLAIGTFLSGCTSASSDPSETPDIDEATVVPLDTLDVVTGQTIYVPAYSELYYADTDNTWNFTITLAVHNADLRNPIYITSVRYYNNDGILVREYVPAAHQLSALATQSYVIESIDRSGGVGANFIVEWVAETDATPPIVEAVMISTARQQGLSLISPGRVIDEVGSP